MNATWYEIASEDSEQAEIIELHNKILEDKAYIRKILTSLQKQSDENCEAGIESGNDGKESCRFDINADMAEGIHLSPAQIELWEKIVEQMRLHIDRRIGVEGKTL